MRHAWLFVVGFVALDVGACTLLNSRDGLTGGVAGAPAGAAGAGAQAGSGAAAASGGAAGHATSGGGGSHAARPSCATEVELCTDNGGQVSCCSESLVDGGTFYMGRGEDGSDAFDGGKPDEQPEHVVTVAPFYLDTFEVTVGRFRAFVEAYDEFFPPDAGAGQHPLIGGSGWQNDWSSNLPTSREDLTANVTVACSSNLQTWSATPSSRELYPINCVNWFEAFAFCIWDGGRLPTEAEWEYAAAGGEANRLYPWDGGDVSPELAVYCVTLGTCNDEGDIKPVGSTPLGVGRFGHHDLAGSMYEWVLDWYWEHRYEHDSDAGCSNCANLTDYGTGRSQRSTSFAFPTDATAPATSLLRAVWRDQGEPNARAPGSGFRCARSPD